MSGDRVAAARSAELRERIAELDHAYYLLDDPLVGDDVYDALLDELRSIEAANPELRTPDSPTQRVGGEPVEGFEEYEHLEPMLSLGNARSAEELEAWEGRIRNLLKRFDIAAGTISYVTEPKIDGLAISLTYEDGVFARGTTRGDGRIGEDVTHNLRTIRSIPLRIPDPPELIEVRGEIYFSRSGFAHLNERRAEAGLATFANPRNAAAGTIRQHDPALAAERPLQSGPTESATGAGSSTRPTATSSTGCASAASRSTTGSPSTTATARSSSAAGGGSANARGSITRSTAPSSRSTIAASGASSASSAANRATRSPGSSRR